MNIFFKHLFYYQLILKYADIIWNLSVATSILICSHFGRESKAE